MYSTDNIHEYIEHLMSAVPISNYSFDSDVLTVLCQVDECEVCLTTDLSMSRDSLNEPSN